MTRIWILALVLLATSCAGTSAPEIIERQPPRFLSLPPESLGRSLSLSQLVTGEYDGQIYKMRYELDITPARLAMVGLSPLGVTVFTIVEEKGELAIETLVKGEAAFDPRYTLFDLYLTYWPSEVLQAALSKIRMRLDETTDGSVRRVRGADGELIAEVTYPPKHKKNGEIIIQHFDFPYRLRIETLKREEHDEDRASGLSFRARHFERARPRQGTGSR